MASDTLTFTLAAVGAGTGIASSATQVYSTTVDRPRLRMDFGMTTRRGNKPSIWLEVTNAGRRATTVRQFGFYGGEKDIAIVHEGETEPWATGSAEVTFTEGSVYLDAGKSHRVEMVPNIEEFGIHADYPFRAFAVDIRGRRIWGEAAPVIRMLIGDEPPLMAQDPASLRALFEPRRPELRPAKVEPRWKLWKRRELRSPDSWRPHGQGR